jgi:hypothetical protein
MALAPSIGFHASGANDLGPGLQIAGDATVECRHILKTRRQA